VMYVLSADGPHGYEGHFSETASEIPDAVGGLECVDDSVEDGSVDVNADVVLGVYDLMRHVDDLGLELDRPDVLSAGVVVVQAWLEGALELAESLDEADGRGLHAGVSAATETAHLAQA
jgi:hypothetical protein